MHPISVRFRDDEVPRRLRQEARAAGLSASALAERLIDEGLRTRRHPLVMFRDGLAGRRAALVGGPDVWEVIEATVGGDVPVSKRTSRTARVLGLQEAQVQAALAYYAEFTAEIDSEITENRDAVDAAEKAWRQQQELLAR